MTVPVRRGPQLAALSRLLRRNADFRRLFLASLVSFLGDWFALVAVSGLVKDLTGSEGATALVFAAEVLPIFLFAPFAGVLADRIDRRHLMIGSAVGRVIPASGLLLALATGQAWLAYLCVAAISVLAAFYEPVVAAVVPNVVDDDDLSLAQTAIGSVWGTMLFVGAAVGGLVAAVFGREVSFVVNAATFAVAAGLIWRIRVPLNRGTVAAAGASVLAHLGEVWRFIRPRKVTRAFMVTKAGVGIGNGIVGLLPVYATDVYGAGDAGIGLLLAGRGLGALVGPFAGRALYRDEGRRLLLVCGGSIVTYAIAYAFLPAAPTLWVAVAFIMVAHAGGGNQWVASTAGLQLTTPDGVRGRVMSLDFALATLAMGTSALAASGLAALIGLESTTYVLAGAALVYGTAWLAWTRDLWSSGEDPVAAARHRDVPPPGPST